MLDFDRDSEGNKTSLSPDPFSSSPESVNSEMEELIRSRRIVENGSPGIEPKRIVVSSSTSQLRRRTKLDLVQQDSNENVDVGTSLKISE